MTEKYERVQGEGVDSGGQTEGGSVPVGDELNIAQKRIKNILNEFGRDDKKLPKIIRREKPLDAFIAGLAVGNGVSSKDLEQLSPDASRLAELIAQAIREQGIVLPARDDGSFEKLKNPLIGPDGKDYDTVEDLQAAREKWAERNLEKKPES